MSKLKIINKNDSIRIDISEERLYNVLVQRNLLSTGICGGKGICGKCKVQFVSGAPNPSTQDQRFFSKQELEAGWRLACTAKLIEDAKIRLPKQASVPKEPCAELELPSRAGLAIDIGSTTIVYAIVDLDTDKTIDTFSELNENRIYGADVMSRIESANSGHAKDMTRQLRQQISNWIQSMFQENLNRLENIVIACNTTMTHILMGYSMEKLGVYPFEAVNLDMIHTTINKLFPRFSKDNQQDGGMSRDIPITILPAISAFVGGDIVSGISYLKFTEAKKPMLLIDFGTNAEMVLADGKGTLFTTSVAAGPAFEGGNISCGTGSIAGAICRADYINGKIYTKTIGNVTPTGICGSGVLEILSELRKAEIVDETGLLSDEYFETGVEAAHTHDGQPIIVTQSDIRELQKAKSAIATGVEFLLQKAGILPKDLETVYLAGNFGSNLNTTKIMNLKMFPIEFRNKIKVAGNTSLEGAIHILLGDIKDTEPDRLREHCTQVMLANEDGFHERYLENMSL